MNPSYSKVPRIYGLPKIHKEGNKYRPIVDNSLAHCHRLSKFLCARFATMKSYDNFSVQNAIDLTNKLKPIKMQQNEVLVSFDIASYFTSVPVEKALECLQTWLDRHPVDHIETHALYELTKVCAENTYFQFRGKYYKQTNGMPMGNSLSPFLCNLYVNYLEEELMKCDLFPKTWFRYVDDVIAIVDEDKIDRVLNLINGICPHIKFTVERQHNGRLPFLDLMLEKGQDGKILFDIYRKPTSANRFITTESHHHTSHKMAAFNSMVFRMCNIPLSEDNFEKEKQHIYMVARINGYTNATIDSLIKKHKKCISLKETTSLAPLRDDTKRVSMHFYEPLHNKLQRYFTRANITLAAKSTTKIKQLLSSTKDIIPNTDKPGVYMCKCGQEDCEKCYIGQTGREMKVRAREHIRCQINNTPHSSAIAEHSLQTHHPFTLDNFSLIECEHNKTKRDILEAIHIHKHRKNSLNRDDGVHLSPLYSLL